MSALMPKRSVDNRLIKAAMKMGHTAEDLSDAVNGTLNPAQAVVRVKELLNSPTAYDEGQERRLLLLRMSAWLDELMETHGKNLKAAPSINRALKLVSDQLERTVVHIEDVSTKLGVTHAEYFVMGFMKAMDIAIERFQEQSGEILDAEVLDVISQEAIEAAREYVETVTVKPVD